jgi:hypothetical protein
MTLWRSAIVRQPAAQFTQETLLRNEPVWLPTPARWAFRADPFGIWHGGRFYVFVETFDYRDRRGRIEVLTYSGELELLSIDLALQEPWHLSYPFVFASDGEIWMLPEARRSGKLTLYRATDFPLGWNAELSIPVQVGALDATPMFRNGKWWLFYCLRQSQPERANQLHIAFAHRLEGPWLDHALNPVRVSLANARPGGTPILGDGHIDLPVQDARSSYGGALRRLRITVLDEERFEAEDGPWLGPAAKFAPFDDGVHTLSSAGTVSLVDLKRIDGSISTRLANAWMKRRNG